MNRISPGYIEQYEHVYQQSWAVHLQVVFTGAYAIYIYVYIHMLI